VFQLGAFQQGAFQGPAEAKPTAALGTGTARDVYPFIATASGITVSAGQASGSGAVGSGRINVIIGLEVMFGGGIAQGFGDGFRASTQFIGGPVPSDAATGSGAAFGSTVNVAAGINVAAGAGAAGSIGSPGFAYVNAGVATGAGAAGNPYIPIAQTTTGVITLTGGANAAWMGTPIQGDRTGDAINDTFTRNVALGLGGAWVWEGNNRNTGHTNPSLQGGSVPGTEAWYANDPTGATNWWEFYSQPVLTSTTGTLTFDFWVPAVTEQFTSYRIGCTNSVEFCVGAVLALTGTGHTSGEWQMSLGPSSPFTRFTPVPSTWYTCEWIYTPTTTTVRVWKRVDPRPSTGIVLTRNLTGPPTPDVYVYVDIPAAEPARFDNFIYTPSGGGGLLINAHPIAVTGQRPGPDIGPLDAPGAITISTRPPATEMLWSGGPTRVPIGEPSNQTYVITIPEVVVGGTFTLTADSGLGTTGAIAWNASLAAVRAAVQAAWGTDVSVTGDDLTVGDVTLEFAGALANTRYIVTMAASFTFNNPGPPPIVGATATRNVTSAVFSMNAPGTPSTRHAGDLVVASVSFDGLNNASVIPVITAGPTSPPNGMTWTQAKLSQIGSGDQYLVTWYAVMTDVWASNPGALIAFQATPNVSRDWAVVAFLVSGAGTSGIELVGENQVYVNSTSHPTTAIGTPTFNELLIGVWSGAGPNTNWTNLSSPMTPVANAVQQWASVYVGQETTSTTSIATRSLDSTSNTITQTHWFALKPATIPIPVSDILIETNPGSNGGFGGGGSGPGVGGGGDPSHGGADPSKPGNVTILIGETDYAKQVVYEDAEFISSTNGEAGSCHFKIKFAPDDDREIITGKRITLKFKGVNQWTGYVMQVHRVYLFSYEDIQPAHPRDRFILVEGADINILFNKRYVYKLSDPSADDSENMTFKISKGPTSDITALTELHSNWVDLTGDDIDTNSMVDHVGDINTDQDVTPWSWGLRWGDAISSIAQLPAAIYCIDPDRRLVFADVDKREAPFVLQDRLSHTSASYRELEIIHDGSDLVTDVMAWGLGTGKKEAVFKRIQSDPEGHGIWQDGELRYDIYKQATINRVAESIINGSVQSKRGHKLDKIAIQATTFTPGFRAGQRVGFRSYAWGYVDTVPIRKIRITFPLPTVPKFELTLSHEIDAPWNFLDVFNFNIPEIPVFEIPVPTKGSVYGLGPCVSAGTTASLIADNFKRFDRTVSQPVWGVASKCGIWSEYVGHSGFHYVTAAGPPHCFLILARGFIQAGDTHLPMDSIDFPGQPDSYPGQERYGGSWSISTDTHGVVTASIGLPSGMAHPTTTTMTATHPNGNPFGSSEYFYLRVIRSVGSLVVRIWPAIEEEPEEYVELSVTPPYYNQFDNIPIPLAADFDQAAAGLGGTLYVQAAPTDLPLGIVANGGAHWGYGWFQGLDTSPNAGGGLDIDTQHSPTGGTYPSSWKARYYPAGDAPPGYPHDTPVSSLDAACTTAGAPHFPRPASATAANQRVDYTLFANKWAWDDGFGNAPQGDGRMVFREYYIRGFITPPSCVGAELTCKVYVEQTNTSFLGLGNPPSPPGEGPVSYELWQVHGFGAGSIVPPEGTTHLAAGTFAGYNGDVFTGAQLGVQIYDEIHVTMAVEPLSLLQIGGRIADSDSYLINTFGQAPSFPQNSGGSRNFQLKITDVRMKFFYDPVGCGFPTGDGGEQIVSIYGPKEREIKIPPYFMGTTKIWAGGKMLELGTDYVETTPLKGIVTLTKVPNIFDMYVFVFRAATPTGGAGLPTNLKLRPAPRGG
jgi:hypothetical protein